MPCILVRGCDIRQPISKQHLQSSVSKCERQLNSQQLTDTERSCNRGREGGLRPIKQNSRLATHLPRLDVIFLTAAIFSSAAMKSSPIGSASPGASEAENGRLKRGS
ncbi:uncharacterized [Tachysurus ichikawai]